MANEKSIWLEIITTGAALLFGEEERTPRRRSAKSPARAKPKPKPQARPTVNAKQAGDERTVHRVRQKYRTSCGIAAAAMLARVSHEEALAVIFPSAKGKAKRRKFNTHYQDVMKALKHFGVVHAERPTRVKAWENIPATSLVKVKWFGDDGKVGWHWVVFQRKSERKWRVLDPDATRKETQLLTPAEYSRYTPVSYLVVNARAPHADGTAS